MRYLTKWPMVAVLAATMFTTSARANLVDPVHYTDPNRPSSSSPESEASWVSGELGTDLIFLGRYGPNGSIGGGEDPYGLLSGGKILITNYPDSNDQSVDVWWDLSGTGYELRAVFLKDGEHGDTLYQTSLDQRVMSNGWQTADLLSDLGGISHVSFFGEHVPDGGLTVTLLSAGFLGLGFVRRFLGYA